MKKFNELKKDFIEGFGEING
jgi:hypothetical protein